jgi:hypothetical protein
MRRDKELFRAVMRNDLASFAKRAIAEIMPGLELEWNWHLDYICARSSIRLGFSLETMLNVCCALAMHNRWLKTLPGNAANL